MGKNIGLFSSLDMTSEENLYWSVVLLKTTLYDNLKSFGLKFDLHCKDIEVKATSSGAEFTGYAVHFNTEDTKKVDVYVTKNGKIYIILSAIVKGQWIELNEWKESLSAEELNEKFSELVKVLM